MTHSDGEPREFCFDDPDDFLRLRDILENTGFREADIGSSLGLEWREISSQNAALLLRRTREETPLNTLVRLFLMGAQVSEVSLCSAIGPKQKDAWLRAGLIRREGDGVAPLIRLIPHDGLRVAFDLPPQSGKDTRPDYVMGIGSSSLALAAATIRRRSRWTLDLGCGCGFQSFLAARHSDRVLATDLNPRAVRMAGFNARLNGLGHVECREGDLLAPAAEQRFDLVVTNPPFVVSPETRYIYRDGFPHGRNVTRRIIREVPAFLADGGFCQILCNWANRRGCDWKERLGSWFEGTGCDAWVMRTETLAADAYAVTWIMHTERDSPAEFASRFEKWLEFYAREEIESISGGIVTMRRRQTGTPWLRFDDGPASMLCDAGESFARAFALRDFLESALDDDALLEQRLKLSPDARLRQQLSPASDAWRLETSQLVMSKGIPFSGEADAYLVRFLAQCDGIRTLREVIAFSAKDLGEPPSQVTAAWLEITRRLIAMGFLLPMTFSATGSV